jgi:hypothetical protein
MLRNANVALVAVAMSASTFDVEGLKLSLKVHAHASFGVSFLGRSRIDPLVNPTSEIIEPMLPGTGFTANKQGWFRRAQPMGRTLRTNSGDSKSEPVVLEPLHAKKTRPFANSHTRGEFAPKDGLTQVNDGTLPLPTVPVGSILGGLQALKKKVTFNFSDANREKIQSRERDANREMNAIRDANNKSKSALGKIQANQYLTDALKDGQNSLFVDAKWIEQLSKSGPLHDEADLRKASYATSSEDGLPSIESEKMFQSMELCADGKQRHLLEVHGYTAEKLEKAHYRFNSVSQSIDDDLSVKLHFYYCNDITTVGQLVEKIQEFEAVHLKNRARTRTGRLGLPGGGSVNMTLDKLFTKQNGQNANKKIVIESDRLLRQSGNNIDDVKISDMVAEIKKKISWSRKGSPQNRL